MDCARVQGYLMVVRYWSERANMELQRGDNNAIEAALRLIEGKIEAIREEMLGRVPGEQEMPMLEILEEDTQSGC